MSNSTGNKLIANNAALLSVAALLSFVLPNVVDSMTDGPANFAKVLAQMFPLFAAMPFSCRLVARAWAEGKTSEENVAPQR